MANPRQFAPAIVVSVVLLSVAAPTHAVEHVTSPQRLQIRIAADAAIDHNLVTQASERRLEDTPDDEQRAAWIPCSPTAMQAAKHLNVVVRDDAMLVLTSHEDVDAEVQHAQPTGDEYGNEAIRLMISASSEPKLLKLSQNNLGRVAVVIVEGHIVQAAKLVSPLSSSVVVPARSLAGNDGTPPGGQETEAADELQRRPGALTIAIIVPVAVVMCAALVIIIYRVRKVRRK